MWIYYRSRTREDLILGDNNITESIRYYCYKQEDRSESRKYNCAGDGSSLPFTIST